MKLEEQVCSLELAKRLKELSAKQNSQFYWTQISQLDKDDEAFLWDFARAFGGDTDRQFSAFTVAAWRDVN